MAEDELSRSSAGDDDFEEIEDDTGIDNEGTLDEEEAFEEGDYVDELKDLEAEGEMSLEELRRKYGLPVEDASGANTSRSCSQIQPEESSSFRNNYNLLVEDEDAEDDNDYAPPDLFKKEIRVNEELYQAKIPEVGEAEMSHPISDPLWTPTEVLSDTELDEYLKTIVNIRKEIGQFVDGRFCESRDDEDALCALFRADYDVDKAKNSFPFPQVNKAVISVRAGALDWDDEEKEIFEKALSTYGKNFHLIKRNSSLSYRTIGELVEYYYRWKTSERYKQFRNRQQQQQEASNEDYRQFTAAIMADGGSANQRESNWHHLAQF